MQTNEQLTRFARGGEYHVTRHEGDGNTNDPKEDLGFENPAQVHEEPEKGCGG